MPHADYWYCGQLDMNLYKCITPMIVTDRVVVTDNRILHIVNRHPDALISLVTELNDTIRAPDYILLDDKHKDTGLICRQLHSGDGSLLLVLRICTDSDSDVLTNSVISGWQISRKRLERYLRTGTILYSRRGIC